MKKIPTIFERDWAGDRSRVLDKPHPDCGWVFAGEGVATRKLDGTSCMVRGERFFKRYEMRAGRTAPPGFELAEYDSATDKGVGWVPIGNGPEDEWHRNAMAMAHHPLADGTYELVGPKVQGNSESFPRHTFVRHGKDEAGPLIDVPTEYAALRDWLATQDIEGIVWHHPDGRMAKIKKRDFGLPRKPVASAA